MSIFYAMYNMFYFISRLLLSQELTVKLSNLVFDQKASKQKEIVMDCRHGLRTLNEAFFHQNPKLFGLTIWADIFWALKKSKSWGPFWSYQLNSTANLANFARNGIDWQCQLFSWQLKYGPLFFNCPGCRITILSEIHCYLCPHIFEV